MIKELTNALINVAESTIQTNEELDTVTTNEEHGIFTAINTGGTSTLTAFDGTKFANGGSTQTLPTAVGIGGRMYGIVHNGVGANVTVATTGAETISGSASISLATYESILVQSNGLNWFIIASY